MPATVPVSSDVRALPQPLADWQPGQMAENTETGQWFIFAGAEYKSVAGHDMLAVWQRFLGNAQSGGTKLVRFKKVSALKPLDKARAVRVLDEAHAHLKDPAKTEIGKWQKSKFDQMVAGLSQRLEQGTIKDIVHVLARTSAFLRKAQENAEKQGHSLTLYTHFEKALWMYAHWCAAAKDVLAKVAYREMEQILLVDLLATKTAPQENAASGDSTDDDLGGGFKDQDSDISGDLAAAAENEAEEPDIDDSGESETDDSAPEPDLIEKEPDETPAPGDADDTRPDSEATDAKEPLSSGTDERPDESPDESPAETCEEEPDTDPGEEPAAPDADATDSGLVDALPRVDKKLRARELKMASPMPGLQAIFETAADRLDAPTFEVVSGLFLRRGPMRLKPEALAHNMQCDLADIFTLARDGQAQLLDACPDKTDLIRGWKIPAPKGVKP
ncbi:MAG: hypothetical protein H6865_02120 [Rhodospirillales bacterium]|nr:hypothetical protein [Alphaproteobacteria bacterium]MCB9986413.1 hypothetical protein [Rhodospirillales bacterium]USO07041.1 MAG: hypothetical protein H6866_06265 [Rhodospirillales bacterium]